MQVKVLKGFAAVAAVALVAVWSTGRTPVTASVPEEGPVMTSQMDQLDAQRSIVLARTPAGLNLSAVVLP